METILIVDDSKMSRTLSKIAFEEKGYTTIEAASGEDALEVIEQKIPDLILLDIVMPGISGLETCKIVKNNDRTRHVPIILVSAIEEFPTKKEGYQVGADDYIVKPFKIEELILRSEIILKVKREKERLIKQQKEIETNQSSMMKSQSKTIEKEKEMLLHQIYVALHHEIRNPLTSILIGSQVLNAKFPPESSEKKILSEIETCAKRIRDIMDSLGNMKSVIVDDYVHGTKMVNLRNPENQSEKPV